MASYFPGLAAAGNTFENRRVDGASVAAFRVFFGLLGLAVVIRFFAHGRIGPLYVDPTHHFTYLGFGWVQPWPDWWMYTYFAVVGLLSLDIVVGCRPRLYAVLFCIGFTYMALVDRTTYCNHYYLMNLVSLLLAILPWQRNAVPLRTIRVLRAQIGIVYLFAGLAKLNPDWLFDALPMCIWMYQHGDLLLIGTLLQETWVAYAMSWGGALFDLAVVPALVWQPARLVAYILLLAFHLSTWVLFPQLVIFPWLMIGLSLIFSDSEGARCNSCILRWAARTGSGSANRVDCNGSFSSLIAANNAGKWPRIRSSASLDMPITRTLTPRPDAVPAHRHTSCIPKTWFRRSATAF